MWDDILTKVLIYEEYLEKLQFCWDWFWTSKYSSGYSIK